MESASKQTFFPRVGKIKESEHQLSNDQKERLIAALRATARDIQKNNNELSDQVVKLELLMQSGKLSQIKCAECKDRISALSAEIERLDADDQLEVLKKDIVELELDVNGSSDLLRDSPFKF